MKKRWICLLLAALLCAVPFGGALALSVVEPGEDFYYLDTANVLSEETEGLIFFSNELLYDACGAQIVVAALDTIDGADIYDYAVEMGNSWGIGSAEENNGFLLLMAIEEDNYYALTGSGLSGIFPASVLKEYYDEYLETGFAAKDYDAGAKKFFTAVFDKIADYYNLDISVEDGEAKYQAYISDNSASQNYGGAQGANAGQSWGNYDDGYDEEPYYEEDTSIFDTIIMILVLLVILSALSKMRGGAFWFWRPTFYWPFFGPRRRPPHGPDDRHGPGPGNRRPPRGGGGGFGGGHSGGGGFGGGHSGGFGGGHSGGGGGFGGGAGRGRH